MGDNHEFKNQEARALVGTIDWDTGQGLPGFPSTMQTRRKALRLDPTTHGILVMDYPHHEIHSGEHHVGVKSILADTDGELNILFKSPSIVPGYGATGHPLDANRRRKAHMEIVVSTGFASYVELYKDSTKTFNAGSLIPYWNRNFHAIAASEKYFTSAMSICSTAGGTETSVDKLGPIYIGAVDPGGFFGGDVKIGGAAGGRNEFILQPDQWYHLKVVSRDDNNTLTAWFDWYDHAEQSDYTG